MIHKWRILLFNFFIISAVGIVFFISSPVHATIIQSDVVSLWTLDETTATGTYSDALGSNPGEDPSAGNPPTPETAGEINGAQAFTAASTQGIDVPDINDDFDWGATDSFSIEFWMKGISGTTGAGATNEVMVGRESGGFQPLWWIGVQNSNQKVACYFVDSDGGGGFSILETSVDPAVVLDGNWHHIVCVRDYSTRMIQLYVDGNMTEGAETFNAGFASAVDVNLGYMNGQYYFNGSLDEVALYNRALTAAEVLALFNAEEGPRYFVQSDTDGISDGEENAGPNNGDANQDGIPDMNQNTVASLLTINGGTEYVTIETSAGTLASCAAVDNPSAGDTPLDRDFPWGFFNFTINGLNSGDPATVTMRTPAGTAPKSYYKYGPPTPGETDAWYDFGYDAQTLTGAEDFTDNVVTLKFVDGQRGDDTAADGSIVDQGGPATVLGSSGAGGCFIATAAHTSGLVRISLLPVIGMSWAALKLGLLPTLALMFFCGFCLIGTTIFRKKK